MVSEAFLNQLSTEFSQDRFTQDPDLLLQYARDWTRFHEPKASLVFFPRTAQEVSKFLKLCSKYQIHIVPSGGRTGLAAGAVATRGEAVLSLQKMNQISEIDLISGTVRAESGAITQTVLEKCAEKGLTWPIDLAAKGSSTIGGNISTNAGGVRVIRYGHTRHWVQSLEVVFMNGDIVELSGNLEKNNTGYDLRQLLIGSEGTLGVVTAATLKLVPKIKNQSTLFFGLNSIDQVLKLLSEFRVSGFIPTAFEVLTDACMKAVCRQMNKTEAFANSYPFYALLEIETPSQDAQLLTWLETLLEKEIVQDGTLAQNSTEAKSLWGYRENITESLSQMGRIYKNDIAVPISAMASFMTDLWKAFPAWYPGCQLFLFGHVGDGNIHVNVLKANELGEAEFLKLCERRNHDLFALVKKYQGSIAAEHGIGLLKKDFLSYCRTPQELQLFRSIKKIFDPQGLLNPGKIFDESKL